MSCESCGMFLRDTDRFCPACGTPRTDAPHAATDPVGRPRRGAPTDAALRAPTSTVSTAPDQDGRPSRRRRIAVVAGCIVVAGVAVFGLSRGDGDTPNETTRRRPSRPSATLSLRQRSLLACADQVSNALEYVLDEGFSSQFAYDSVLDEFGYETLEGRSFMDAYTRVALDASSQGAARLRGNTIPYASAACARYHDRYGHD